MAQPILWAGIDAGKAAHHCVAINADGQRVLSRRVVNDEAALIDLIRADKELGGGGSVRGQIDLNSGGAALLITLLLDDGQDLLYIPGRNPLRPGVLAHPRRRQDRCQAATDKPHLPDVLIGGRRARRRLSRSGG